MCGGSMDKGTSFKPRPLGRVLLDSKARYKLRYIVSNPNHLVGSYLIITTTLKVLTVSNPDHLVGSYLKMVLAAAGALGFKPRPFGRVLLG